MQAKQKPQGLPGFRWLWKLMFGHGFWWGFGTAFCMTPVLMILLSLAWNGHIPGWSGQFKSFIIGDPLLAVIVGLLAVLTGQPARTEYKPANSYWYKWYTVGFLCSALFIFYKIRTHKMHFTQLFTPHLLYHHILLISLFVTMLAGMGYVQYHRHPRSRLWLVMIALFLCYILLSVYDVIRPPIGPGT
jgi:hypothetical protein